LIDLPAYGLEIFFVVDFPFVILKNEESSIPCTLALYIEEDSSIYRMTNHILDFHPKQKSPAFQQGFNYILIIN